MKKLSTEWRSICLLLMLNVFFATSAMAAPDEDACPIFEGEPTSKFSARIINGTSCRIGDSAVVEILKNGSSSCTGVVISDRLVLTAAHCTTKPEVSIDDNSRYSCQVGNDSSSLQKIKDGVFGVVDFSEHIKKARKKKRRFKEAWEYYREIGDGRRKRSKRKLYQEWSSILKGIKRCRSVESDFLQVKTGLKTIDAVFYQGHPSWDEDDLYSAAYDIGVLTLGEDVGTQIMSMLKVNDLQSRETMAIAGYGYTEDRYSPLHELRAGYMTFKSSNEEEIWADFAGYPQDSGSNTCSGDSGGPVAVRRNGSWVLAGTTSWGRNSNCGINGGADESYWANTTSSSNQNFINQYLD